MNESFAVQEAPAGYRVMQESPRVKAGYKQTEVGVIPEDWNVGYVGDSFNVRNQLRLPISQSARERMAGAYPYYGATGVQGWINEYRVEGVYALIGEDGDHFLKWRIQPMTLLVSGKFNVNNHAHLIQGSSNLTEWFYWFFSNRDITNYLTRQGAGRFKLSKAALIQLPCALPSPLEQRAITTALSDVDALLAAQEKLIAKKRDIKQAAMQQLLTGKQRLPGFSEKWEVMRMKSLGNTYGGLTGKTKVDFGHGRAQYIPFMNVMTDTVIDVDWLELVDVSSNEVQNLTQKGDLFFNGSSETPEEVGFCSVLLQDVPNLYLNSFCFGFRFNSDAKVNGLFFAYWFRSVKGREKMAVLAQGATRYNIAKSAFLKLELPQPPEEEQAAIATVLSDMDADLAALEQQRDKTRALKQGMMQALLTGRIRLV